MTEVRIRLVIVSFSIFTIMTATFFRAFFSCLIAFTVPQSTVRFLTTTKNSALCARLLLFLLLNGLK